MQRIAILLFLTFFVACKGTHTDEEMTDSVKLASLDAALERRPKDASLLGARAQVLLDLGRIKEASYDIARALQEEPDNVDFLLLKANICFAGGNVSDSYGALERAQQLSPDNTEVQLKMGEIMFYSRDYDRALQCLTKVTAKEPNNRTALVMKGFVYKEQGDTAKAVQILRLVTDKFPDYALAYEELGVLYASVLNPLAVEYLTTALQLEPSNTNAIYALALYHQDIGQVDEAEALYRRILDINPASADALNNLGYLQHAYHHNDALAAEYYNRALAVDPNHQQAIQNINDIKQ